MLDFESNWKNTNSRTWPGKSTSQMLLSSCIDMLCQIPKISLSESYYSQDFKEKHLEAIEDSFDTIKEIWIRIYGAEDWERENEKAAKRLYEIAKNTVSRQCRGGIYGM